VEHHVRVRGRAPDTLVVINGGPGQSHDYCESTDNLASEKLQVVTYDQRGTGLSERPSDEDHRLATQAADLDAIRQALGVHRLHVLAHSFGGLIAMAYLRQYPERVASLQLVGSSPVVASESYLGEFERRIEAFVKRGVFPVGFDDFSNTDDCAPYFRTIWPVYLNDPALPMSAELQRTTCSLRTYAATAKDHADAWNFSVDVARYRGPAAVYYGDADPFRREAETIPAHVVNAELEVQILERCGHYWQECQAQLFAKVRAFLAPLLLGVKTRSVER
jgi:proline iminopeptidase